MAESTDFIIPELLADQVKIGLAKRRVFLGSPAVTTNPSLPTSARGGSVIKVPYMGSLGEAETGLSETDALTPVAPTPDSETASVTRAGLAFTLTRWAEAIVAYADPYAAMAENLVEAIARAQEQALITAACATLSATTYTVPASGIISYDAVLNTKKKWGDEIDDIVMMAMHSKAFYDVLGLKDSTGRPLGVETIRDDGSVMRSFAGVPVMVSDFMPLDTGVYTTALLKRSSLLLWENPAPKVDEDKNILADSRIASINAYFVAYRYKYMPGRSKPGVALIKHT